VTREVIFSPEALTDLFELYDYIAADAGAARAHSYTDRIVATCRNLVTFPERGTRRDDLRPGLRTTTFRRRVTIGYHITEAQVIIDRILYGGRNLPDLFAERDDDGA
jgi:toxin ParE1/3/4